MKFWEVSSWRNNAYSTAVANLLALSVTILVGGTLGGWFSSFSMVVVPVESEVEDAMTEVAGDLDTAYMLLRDLPSNCVGERLSQECEDEAKKRSTDGDMALDIIFALTQLNLTYGDITNQYQQARGASEHWGDVPGGTSLVNTNLHQPNGALNMGSSSTALPVEALRQLGLDVVKRSDARYNGRQDASTTLQKESRNWVGDLAGNGLKCALLLLALSILVQIFRNTSGWPRAISLLTLLLFGLAVFLQGESQAIKALIVESGGAATGGIDGLVNTPFALVTMAFDFLRGLAVDLASWYSILTVGAYLGLFFLLFRSTDTGTVLGLSYLFLMVGEWFTREGFSFQVLPFNLEAMGASFPLCLFGWATLLTVTVFTAFLLRGAWVSIAIPVRDQANQILPGNA